MTPATEFLDRISKVDPVPCRGCTACCRGNQAVVLREEWGDDPTAYDKVARERVGGSWQMVLPRQANGDCAHLVMGACQIYEKRPAVCRYFDCRRQLLGMGKRGMKQAEKQGLFSREIYNAARDRLGTITPLPGEAEVWAGATDHMLKRTRGNRPGG